MVTCSKARLEGGTPETGELLNKGQKLTGIKVNQKWNLLHPASRKKEAPSSPSIRKIQAKNKSLPRMKKQKCRCSRKRKWKLT